LGVGTSLGKPSDITGATMLAIALEAKRLTLVHEIGPTATLVGMFISRRWSACSVSIPRQSRGL